MEVPIGRQELREKSEINLDEWRWLRKISGNDPEAIKFYKEQARKNEALMVEIYGQYAYNIYLPIKKKPKASAGIGGDRDG